MQDFDTLRERVEATTEKLKSAQADRQDQTESLVAILRQLEEKHAAQAQQLTYYKKRVAPLEQANQQLAALMETLLDLIDGGFGDDSLAPLRDASRMAAAMLDSELFVPEQNVSAQRAVAAEETGEDVTPEEAFAEDASEGDEPAALARTGDEDFAEDDPSVGVEETVEAAADAATDDGAEGAPDLEMEEDALISLDELLDLASEESPEETVAFEEMGQGGPVMAADEETEEPDQTEVAADSPYELDALSDGGIIDDGGFDAEFFGAETDGPVAAFEDVSDATLAFESEEDAAAGADDLPAVVKHAMAAFEADDAVGLVPEIPDMRDEADAAAAAEDDLETIAALAQAIEEETANEGAPPPAQSDIRALLLRVEKLAKKAEAMRLAQGGGERPPEPARAKAAKPRRQAGAAA